MQEIKKDLAGRPFVGRAGKLLNEGLETVEINRKNVYITNTVKHFKWASSPHGNRLSKKPVQTEIDACRPWLHAELRIVKPKIIVCLGSVAAQSVIAKNFSVMREHGQWTGSDLAPHVTATLHPSAILRGAGSRPVKSKCRYLFRTCHGSRNF